MKKSLLIIPALFFCTMLFAQETLSGSYTELYVGSEWEPYDSTATKVDFKNRIEENIIKRYNNGSWKNSLKEKYTYTQEGLLENTLFYEPAGAQWATKSAIFYAYNPDKTIRMERMATWNTSVWQDAMIREYYYNKEIYADSSILYVVDAGGSKHPSQKMVYGYDNNGKLMNLLIQNLSSSGWVDSESISYKYNFDGKKTGALREGITKAGVTMLDSILYEYTELGNLKKAEKKNLQANVPVERTVYQYSILVNPGSVISSERINSMAYPNPFRDKLTIIFDQAAGEQYCFSLYDGEGRELRYIPQVQAGRVSLDRNDLASGIYFYKIQSDTKLISGQVIAD